MSVFRHKTPSLAFLFGATSEPSARQKPLPMENSNETDVGQTDGSVASATG